MTDTDIEIRIKAEATKASKDIARLTKELDKMNKTVAKGGKVTEQNVGQMTRSFKSLTAHVSKLALIYGSFKTLMTGIVITAKFEESIKKLGIYSGATAGELGDLEQKAKDLGESTVFSASQVAEGMNEMALAGLSSSDMLAGIGDTLNLASVGMISLKESTDITVTAMKTFGLEATDMNDITDIFAKGSTVSATTVTQLGQAMKKVGAVANSYGTTLEETTSLLGTLADGGRRGAEAGTQLKIAMLRLASNPEAKKYLDALGVSMYEMVKQADGTEKQMLIPFTEQLRILRERLKDLDAESRNEAMARIFGTEAVASAEILMNNLEEVHMKLEKIRDAMANDFAMKSAKAMVDTLIGSYKNLLSALEGLAIKIVAEMTPAIREMLDSWTETVRGMDEDSINDFANALSNMIDFVGGVSSAITSLAGVVIGFIGDNKALSASLLVVAGGFKLASTAMAVNFVTAMNAGSMSVTRFTGLMIVARLKVLEFLSSLMLHPVMIAITALVGATVLYVDHLERQNKEAEKSADLAMKQSKALGDYTDKMAKLITTTEDGTVVLGKNNLERSIASIEIGKAIDALQKHDKSLDKSVLGEKEYNRQKKANTEQLKLFQEMMKLVASSWTDETKAVDKETIALLKNVTASAKAIENYEVFSKVLQKRVTATEKAIAKITKAEQGLLIKQAQLEKERANIIKKYADQRLQVLEDYEQIAYDGQTAGLSAYKKYTSDMLRADELLAKAREALSKGRIAEASRYYSEAKSLASSHSGTVIEENGKILANSTQTYNEASKRFAETKRGEIEIIRLKEIAELKANKQKLEMVALELKAQKALMNIQVKVLEQLTKLGDVAKDTKEKFDEPEYLEKLNKDFDDMIARADKDVIEAKLDLNKAQFDNKMTLAKGDATTLKSSIKQIGETPVKIKVDSKELVETAEEAQWVEKLLMRVDGQYVYVDVGVDGIIKAKEEVTELHDKTKDDFETVVTSEYHEVVDAKVKVKDLQNEGKKGVDVIVKAPTDEAERDVDVFVRKTKRVEPVTQDLKTNVLPAYGVIVDFSRWVQTQELTMPLVIHPSSVTRARNVIDNFVYWASRKTIRIPIETYQANANGGLIAPLQRLAEGGTFTGSGRVAGYDATDSDKVTAKLTGGEFVVRREAVDKIGLSTLHAINNMSMAKPEGYASGGQVGGSGSTGGMQPITLNLGGNGQFTVYSPVDIASGLQEYLEIDGGL